MKDKATAEPWLLAVSTQELSGSEAQRRCGRRWCPLITNFPTARLRKLEKAVDARIPGHAGFRRLLGVVGIQGLAQRRIGYHHPRTMDTTIVFSTLLVEGIDFDGPTWTLDKFTE